MRGGDDRTGSLFSYVDLEVRVPAGHPLRAMRELVNISLAALDGSFAALYAKTGRPSIAPERMLRAVLLQMLYSIRSERQLMERLEFDLLFRWFVGLGIDDAVWDASSFSKNRDRLLTTEVAQGFPVGPACTACGQVAVECGAFFGRRDDAEGVCLDKELPGQGRFG